MRLILIAIFTNIFHLILDKINSEIIQLESEISIFWRDNQMILLSDVAPRGLPKTWKSKPFWNLFRRVKRTVSKIKLLSVYRDYGVIPKTSRDDNHNKESEDLSKYQLVKERFSDK